MKENCTVHAASTGQTVSGTILIQNFLPCLQVMELQNAHRQYGSAFGCKKVSNEKKTRPGIEVGDFISFDPRTVVTETGFIKSRHLDDKVSAAILLNLRVYKEEGTELPVTTHFLFQSSKGGPRC